MKQKFLWTESPSCHPSGHPTNSVKALKADFKIAWDGC